MTKTDGRSTYRDLTNERFGRYVVIAQAERAKSSHRQWQVKCDCGEVRTVVELALKRGTSKSCGCIKREGWRRRSDGGYHDLTATFWYRILNNAANRKNLDVFLTPESAYRILVSQNFACPYTGRTLTLGPPERANHLRNCSLDRIDSDGPYSLGNCEWVYLPVNMMKGTLSRRRLMELAVAVAEPALVHGRAEADQPLTKFKWNSIRRVAEHRGRSLEVDATFAQQMFVSQGGRCALSGQSLWLPKTVSELTSANASLDRIDSAVGYVAGNIQWVTKEVNMMKRDLQQAEFVSLCREIAAHAGAAG